MITLTTTAQEYLIKLAKNPEHRGKVLRLRALDVNTPYAEAGLEFVELGPEHTEDILMTFAELIIYIEAKHKSYLLETTIDYQVKGLQQELIIETPHLKPIIMLTADADLAERITQLLEAEVNPALAMHGGMVRLVEITPENEVILQFGGGCQACSMSDVTLKQGVEKTLKEHFPEIIGVRDSTEHDQGANPYY